MYKIDDKLCRNSECGRQSALSVSKTVQAKRNQGEILHTFAKHEEHYAIPSQLIVIFVHGLKRLHPSSIIQVDVGAASLLLFAKGTGYFGSRGVRGAGLDTVILRH